MITSEDSEPDESNRRRLATRFDDRITAVCTLRGDLSVFFVPVVSFV